MPTDQQSYAAEAVVATPRAQRYLAQLCDHLQAIGRAQPQSGHQSAQHARHDGERVPPLVARDVRRSTTQATIRFDNGACRLLADGDRLRVLVSAADSETLARLMASFAHRLEQIGRRDELSVIWTAPAS